MPGTVERLKSTIEAMRDACNEAEASLLEPGSDFRKANRVFQSLSCGFATVSTSMGSTFAKIEREYGVILSLGEER